MIKQLLVGGALASAALSPALAQSVRGGSATDEPMDEIVVQATRSTLPTSALPNTITVIPKAVFAREVQLTGSTTEAVSSLIPSFSPTREKLTGSGETLRGRNPLFLIDGVPQANPLRDGSRDGYTVDPFFIDRVEVIFGSNAIQGVGATGGVVNYVTAAPPAEGKGWTGRALAQTSGSREFEGDGSGYRLAGLVGKDFGALDLTVGVASQKRGAYYSGDGERIGVDGTQGEVQDSESLSFFGKGGIDFTPERRLELMAQRFELEGDGDYVQVTGSRAEGRPSTSIRGESPGVIPTNEVTTVSLTYSDADLYGGTLSAQLFYQDFEAVFGGGAFATFQDPAIDPSGELFDQSANNSTKKGARVSYERELEALPGFSFRAGLDRVEDRTFQELIATGRNWVPETDFISVAPFLQLHQSLLDSRLHVSAGYRREDAKVSADDYTTLFRYGPQQVAGGEPGFTEDLVNLGATFELVDGLTAYAAFAQGFTMPDVGRILRAVDVPGQDVDDLFDLEPVVSDNTELGLEWNRGPLGVTAAYYQSDSDNGSRLVLVDEVFEVQRQRTDIEGLEFNVSWDTPVAGLTFTGGYAWADGRTDTDGDGALDSDLDGANISPNRLNLAADYVLDSMRFRLRTRSYLDRDFDGLATSEQSFDGYTLLDAFAEFDVAFGTVFVSGSNLLDEDYVTYDSQTVRTTSDTRFFAGRGRVVNLGIELEF